MRREDAGVGRVSMSDDYFALLGMGDANFSIDLKLMEKNYIDIQRCSHPDRFFHTKDKESAVRHIAKVNKAYLVLKSPVSRAEYILEGSGTKLSDEDRSKVVEEVFDLELSASELDAEMQKCVKLMEGFFSNGDMYQAAVQVEKLKYLRSIGRRKLGCS